MSGIISVDSKGYGKIYKLVMRDRQLPLLAKSIYCYLSAYAGNGSTAFPKRDKIVRDLHLNKDTCAKHMKTLLRLGYIEKKRIRSGNIYTIVQSVPLYEKPETDDEGMTDMLIVGNIGAKGFGTVPKMVMLDPRLSAQAKAIYCYFASFAGAGTTAFPRRTTILRDLGIAPVTFYPHFNQLKDYGYISVDHPKNNGRYEVSIYRLNDQVEYDTAGNKSEASEKPVPEKNGVTKGNTGRMSEKPVCGNNDPQGEFSTSEKPGPEKPLSEKPSSEKTGHGKFGRANIKNSLKSNSSLRKEQYHNHQASGEENGSLPLFSHAQDREIIGYDDLYADAVAWGELKQLLGHFSGEAEKKRYLEFVSGALGEIMMAGQQMLSTSDHPARIVDALQSPRLEGMIEEILCRWSEIHNVRRYIAEALKNLVKANPGR